jgi:acyl-CoA thioesterase-1
MDAKGQHQVPLEQYEKNLAALVQKMKGKAKLLIWCSTTPVPEGVTGVRREPADVPLYNGIAKRIMTENKIPTNDLYAFALPQLKEIQLPVNVHYSDHGSAVLATQVATAIEQFLSRQVFQKAPNK